MSNTAHRSICKVNVCGEHLSCNSPRQDACPPRTADPLGASVHPLAVTLVRVQLSGLADDCVARKLIHSDRRLPFVAQNLSYDSVQRSWMMPQFFDDTLFPALDHAGGSGITPACMPCGKLMGSTAEGTLHRELCPHIPQQGPPRQRARV